MARSIEVSERAGVRYLHFGSPLVQGAMRIARPWALELEYTREMLFPLLLAPRRAWPRHVLQVGLGAASLSRFLHRHFPRTRLTVVEISPGVVAAARQFFRLPEPSARFAIEVAEGHDWLAGSRRRFDLILVDGFDAEGRAGTLEGLAFYRECRAHLEEGGMMAANLLTRRRSVGEATGRLGEAFAGRTLVLPSGHDGNTVAIAMADGGAPLDAARLQDAAARLRQDTGLDLAPTLRRLGLA